MYVLAVDSSLQKKKVCKLLYFKISLAFNSVGGIYDKTSNSKIF
jgi:hypothetical protein